MIKFKDLQNRVYRGKTCVLFEYALMVDDQYVVARFERQMKTTSMPNEWNMQIIFGRMRNKDSEVYNFGYVMPKDNVPLELICATGLKYFQLHIKEEIQAKSNLDFELGEILQGM